MDKLFEVMLDPMLQESAFKLGFALVLAALFGLERDVHGRSAGLRTHILICVGCTLSMIVALALSKNNVVDPSRVVGQILTGIGFLGAGVIIKTGLDVRGLTTAASIWVGASLGIAVGAGLYGPAIVITVISLLVLLILGRAERLYKKGTTWQLKIRLGGFQTKIDDMLPYINNRDVKVIYVEQSKHYDEDTLDYRVRCRVNYKKSTYEKLERVVVQLEDKFHNIKSIHWDHR